MKLIFLFIPMLMFGGYSYADSINIACLKMDWICSSGGGCLWGGNPGQAQAVPLNFAGHLKGDKELWIGQMRWTLDGQVFDLEVSQQRENGKSNLNFLTVILQNLEGSTEILSTGLAFTQARYKNPASKFGVSVRCSTGI